MGEYCSQQYVNTYWVNLNITSRLISLVWSLWITDTLRMIPRILKKVILIVFSLICVKNVVSADSIDVRNKVLTKETFK